MSEYWDVYNEQRLPTGRKHRRGTPLRPGEYHVVVDVVTVSTDGRLLIDRRSPLKRNCPNYWEFTSGSVIEGEDSLTGALRELYEEVGIMAMPEQLRLLGTKRVENRFVDTYLLVTDVDRSSLVLQESEVAEARLVTLDELDRICLAGRTWCEYTLREYRGEIASALCRAKATA